MTVLWIKRSSGMGGVKINFWNKPWRNKNKLELTSSQIKELSTLSGKPKKNWLRLLKTKGE